MRSSFPGSLKILLSGIWTGIRAQSGLAVFLLLLLSPSLLLSQIIADPYQLESDGYLRFPRHTPHGIAATNNYASELYLIRDKEKTTLVRSPGAGRYTTLSPDGSLLGFKSINADGLQAPAVLDLESGHVYLLYDYVDECGQPSFFKGGGVAFTIGHTLRVYHGGLESGPGPKRDESGDTQKSGESVLDGSDFEEYDLGDYVNLSPVSPDGRHAVFNDIDDRLYLLNLTDASVITMSNPGRAAFGPVWSHDGSKVAYMTNGGHLFVYELTTARNFNLGKGSDPSWRRDSEHLVFTRSIIEDFRLESLHIRESRFDGRMQTDLTDPHNRAVRDASVSADDAVLSYDVKNRSVISIKREPDQIREYLQYELEAPDRVRFRPVPDDDDGEESRGFNRLPDHRDNSQERGFDNPGLSTGQGDMIAASYDESQIRRERVSQLQASLLITGVPFVNQVWDTPFFSGNNYNYASCAPTTAAMVIGYFEKVPPWPSYRHQGIRRDYANYVALQYSAYGFTYNTVSRGVMGGMGYMWSSRYGSSGSPRTTMRGYIDRHDLESIQYWDPPYSNLLTELENGHPYPLCVLLTSAGHLILAIGVEDSRRTVIVHDPYGNKNIRYPSYDGIKVVYDWPGYNYGNQNLERVAWTVTARGSIAPTVYHIPQGEHEQGFASLEEAFEWANNRDTLTNNVQFVITDDLDERGHALDLAAPFQFNTRLYILPEKGKQPEITLDSPMVIRSNYVTIDGLRDSGELEKDGDEQLAFRFDPPGDSGTEKSPAIIIGSGSDRVTVNGISITQTGEATYMPVAMILGEEESTGGKLSRITLTNNTIGSPTRPFVTAIKVSGRVEELEITDNSVYGKQRGIVFESSSLSVEILRNRIAVEAGEVGSSFALSPGGADMSPDGPAFQAFHAGLVFQGDQLTMRDNRIHIREAGEEGIRTDGIFLKNMGNDLLFANNMISVLPAGSAVNPGGFAAGIRVHAGDGENPGDGVSGGSGVSGMSGGIRLYHNTVRILPLKFAQASAAFRLTGVADGRLTEVDMRSNIWVNEHDRVIDKAFKGSLFYGNVPEVTGASSNKLADTDSDPSVFMEKRPGYASSLPLGDLTGTGEGCDAAGPLGICLDTDVTVTGMANNWSLRPMVRAGWMNGLLMDDVEQIGVYTSDERVINAPVAFLSDTDLLLHEDSHGDLMLAGYGLPNVVPMDILGNERHPVFPYMGAHEPEPTVSRILFGDYHIPAEAYARGYASLAEAIQALNTHGTEKPVRFLIHSDLDETSSTLLVDRRDLTSGTALTILPAEGKVTIRLRKPIIIHDASHITFDGGDERGLHLHLETMADSSAAGENGVAKAEEKHLAKAGEIPAAKAEQRSVAKEEGRSAVKTEETSAAKTGKAFLITGGSRFVTLRNLRITHDSGSDSGLNGVVVSGDEETGETPRSVALERLILGTTTDPFKDAVSLRGVKTPLTRVQADVNSCEISAARNGIISLKAENSSFLDNVIRVDGRYPDQHHYSGIRLEQSRSMNIRRNQIFMLGAHTSEAALVSGLVLISNESTHNLLNNMISVPGRFDSSGESDSTRIYGVAVSGPSRGERYNFVHNTIYVGRTGQAGRTAAFGWDYDGESPDPARFFIQNTLLTNRHDHEDSWIWYWLDGDPLNVNYNNLDANTSGMTGKENPAISSHDPDVTTSGAKTGYFRGERARTLSDWQTSSGMDAVTTAVPVYYRSETDLRLSGSSEGDEHLAGRFTPMVRTDIFGNPRCETAPYKGAWESPLALSGGEYLSESDVPISCRLHQNYPNPFNPVTTIRFDLPGHSRVRLSIYTITGRRVAILVDENLSAGEHAVTFDASGLSSGVYLYRLQNDDFSASRRMTLIK